MITRPFSSESSPIAESSSNFDDKNVDGKKYISQPGTDSAETKSLAERSPIQTKKITPFELNKLISQQIFSNDVHYQVAGNLSLDNCTGLTALPENLFVECELSLHRCTGLTALPDNLCMEGYLSLEGCTSLTALPENFSVGGSLRLNGCTSLTALPENLSVGGGLSLDGCTGLTTLPEKLSVGGDLSLDDCTGLTALPDWITTMGLNPDGHTRYVYLENTGLSDTLIDRLRNATTPGMRFFFSRSAGQPEQQFCQSGTRLLPSGGRWLHPTRKCQNLTSAETRLLTLCAIWGG